MSAILNGLFGVIARKNAGGSGPSFGGSRAISSATATNSSTVLTLNDDVPSGSILAVLLNGGGAPSSVVDSSSNSYSEGQAQSTSSGSYQAIWFAPITSSLSSGDTVTVSYSSGFSSRVYEVVEIENATTKEDGDAQSGFTTNGIVTLTTSKSSIVVGVYDKSSGSGGTVSGSGTTTLLTATTLGRDVQSFHNSVGAGTTDSGVVTSSATTGKRIGIAFS